MTPERLGSLVDTHAAALELFAAQWTVAAEDVVQEAFVELVDHDAEPRNVAAWLYTVVRNRAISAARASRRRERHEERAARLARRLVHVDETERGLDARTAAAALGELPEEQREVVVARLWGGLGFAEIGEVVGVSSSTAHRRYEQAIEHLRERLGLKWTVTESTTRPATPATPATSSGC